MIIVGHYVVLYMKLTDVYLFFCAKTIFSLILPLDYLVDEGAELSSTTELLLDRTHEQALVDLMTPSLVLLINLLQILHVICSVLFLVMFQVSVWLQCKHVTASSCSYE